jgi:hypothetical protein
MIVNPILSTWVIQTPLIYRFFKERKHVDDFFKDGSLRISSVKRFRSHEDEEHNNKNCVDKPIDTRRDGMEGIGQCCAYRAWPNDRPGENVGVGIVEFGAYSYILSGTIHNTNDLTERFGNAAIRIFDTTAFGIEIGRQIPGLVRGIEGFCNYNDGPVEFLMTGDVPPLEIVKYADMMSSSGEFDLTHFTGGVLTPQRDCMFFRKRRRDEHRGIDYHRENEYRWAWITDHRISPETTADVGDSKSVAPYIDIKCPSARQYCAPFYRDEL